MTTDGFLEFCGSPFWNSSLTWDSKDVTWPEFTECFQNTLLVWAPSTWLLLTTPFYIYQIFQDGQQKRLLSTKNLSKTIISLLLALLTSLEIVQQSTAAADGVHVPPVVYFSTSLRMICYILTAIIVQVERLKGTITSPTLFIYWLFTAIADVIPFYSLILKHEETTDLVKFVIFYFSYALLIVQLILSAFVEKNDNYENLCPEEKASVPSFLLFNWIKNVLWLSFKGKLQEKDIPSLPSKGKSQHLIKVFESHWKKEVLRCEKAKNKKKLDEFTSRKAEEIKTSDEATPLLDDFTSFNAKYSEEKSSLLDDGAKDPYAPSLIRALIQNFWAPFLLAYSCKLVTDVIEFLNPLLLNALIAFTDSDDPQWKGFVLAFCLLFVKVSVAFIIIQFDRLNLTTCMKMKYALIGAIYKKSLRLSSEAKRRFTTGEIVNLMSVDCVRIDERLQVLWILLSSPLQISVSLYFLYNILGVSAFAGLALIICFIPLNLLVTKYTGVFALAQMKVKDHRLNVFGEVISGIKVLKLYAWESSFEKKINDIRKKEVNLLKKSSLFLSVLWFIWTTSPFLVMLASFATYVLTTGKSLDAQTAFVAQSLFNMMRVPMNLLPEMFINLAECYVSLKRLKTYFNAEEINPNNVLPQAPEGKPVVVENGTFSWSKSGSAILSGINLTIPEGSLIAVVGQVGSGKSSLLSCILGDMIKISGNVYVKGHVAYVPQEAWIQNATIKDNILFGSPYIKKKYQKVLEACELLHDLDILPGGDLTEIGEKGINLSGGQKQRISLARAVYADADIYLMDSPLSAVDSNVGKGIFENVMSSTGLLKRKTRIWVTNAIQWLPYVDSVVVLNHGEITDISTYEKLISQGGQFSEFLNTYMYRQSDDHSNEEDEVIPSSPDKFGRQLSMMSETSETLSHRSSKTADAIGQNLTEEEAKAVGSVKTKIYLAYLKAMGLGFAAVMILSLLLFETCDLGSSLWLTEWTGDPFLNNVTNQNTSEYTERTNEYLSVFGLFGLGQACCILSFTVVGAFAYVRASFRLHNNMLFSVLRTPLSFFDTTPMGRITNRFSQDMDIIDNALRNEMNTLLHTMNRILGSIIIIAYSIPIFSALIVPLFIAYVFLLYFYIPTARELERINSVTRSPIYNHFSETLSGTASIRAYAATERFIKQSQERVNTNMRPFYCLVLANQWMAMRMELLSSVLVFFACVAGIMSRGSLNGAILGMTINYAFEITQILNWLLSVLIQFQTSFISVERVIEFCHLKPEASWDDDDDDYIHQSWPRTGNLEFRDYSTRYRPGLDLVLKGINCSINSGEKIGVVGRTGAGKSSLTLGLFRIIEAADGSIMVDDENIANMGLHKLRSKLTIFPQDPVLFSGSMRSNLDPFSVYPDSEIWRALDHAHLNEYIQRQGVGLEYECGENGQNLSMGQKQLVCLARALLHKTKLLVLDEATAAVDLETDALIQQTIRNEFSDCTILTIAHRLNTILDYDRIMVLDQGNIVEFDSPQILMKNQGSRFYQMARDAGCI